MTISLELCETESGEDLPGPFDIQSYKDLLQFPQIPASTISIPSGNRDVAMPLVDAIIVPTFRSAKDLQPAALLAANARCHLVAIYTDSLPAGLSSALVGLRTDQVTMLTVRSGTHDRLLDLGVCLPQSDVSPAALDISRKRNLGLLVGRACGWTRMLFLDDDIRKVNVAKLSSAAALLDDYPVVGLQVNKYPDASVVGHARRLTARRQEPFVSGGSLLVNPHFLNGYFAPIYHEDWLCVINHLRRGKVAIGGSVGQVPYVPFADPDRAKREEFGDVLLSGLLWLVHTRLKKGTADRFQHIPDAEYWREAMNPLFWKQILEQRVALLHEITERLAGMTLDNLSPLPSLAVAKQRLGELEPADFVSFTAGWLTSLAVWRSQLDGLSRVDVADKARAIEKALAKLGLAHAVRTHDLSSQQAPTTATGWKGGFADRWNRWTGTDSRGRFGVRNEL
jgi:hypothetical protein